MLLRERGRRADPALRSDRSRSRSDRARPVSRSVPAWKISRPAALTCGRARFVASRHDHIPLRTRPRQGEGGSHRDHCRTGRWAGTGSALLGFVQFVFGGLASPLVGLSGATSGVAFGIVIVVLGAVANALAAFGLRDRGERERIRAERAAARPRRLGRDQL